MARSAQARFAPSARPQVVTAGDGTLAAIHEPSRIVIVEVPSCDAFAELALDPEASAADVTWVGTPPRLIVLSRYSSHSSIHLVDPFGPRTIAELRLEAPMKLYASVGSHALVMGSLGAGILEATDKSLALHQFPARARPVTAGAAGSQFMVALAGAIEEWDPQSRMPKRRLKLPRPVVISAVGGSDRVVWMTTQQEPSRIDVIPLVNRGQPKAHDLPEPIASIASHPRSDLVAVVGATTGRIFVVDLDGRAGLRIIGPEGIDRVEAVSLVLGRVAGVLAAQAGRPINIVALEREPDREPNQTLITPSSSVPSELSRPNRIAAEPAPPRDEAPVLPEIAFAEPPAPDAPSPEIAFAEPPPSDEPAAPSPPATRATPAAPPPRPAVPPSAPGKDKKTRATWPTADETRAMVSAKASPPVVEVSRPPWAPGEPARTAISTADVITAWRDRASGPRARTAEPVSPLWDGAPPTWRDEAATWARGVLAATAADHRADTDASESQAPASTPLAAIVTRFELSPELQPAVALLYGAHLAGHHGVAPADIASILGGRWDEALGRGELAERGVAFIEHSRVHLAPAITRALDELLPSSGVLVGTPSAVALLGPCAIVAAGPMSIIAEACGSSIGGAILAAYLDADPLTLVSEARAYGAAPMLRVIGRNLERVPVGEPIILVVDDDTMADNLGIPRLR